jgi:hypothetical protein
MHNETLLLQPPRWALKWKSWQKLFADQKYINNSKYRFGRLICCAPSGSRGSVLFRAARGCGGGVLRQRGPGRAAAWGHKNTTKVISTTAYWMCFLPQDLPTELIRNRSSIDRVRIIRRDFIFSFFFLLFGGNLSCGIISCLDDGISPSFRSSNSHERWKTAQDSSPFAGTNGPTMGLIVAFRGELPRLRVCEAISKLSGSVQF